ncbi:nicotinamide riboside transporter PnuC [Capnocytophaga catalasegens]|uniref:Nicotinamide riboside transporter PnuC n=1 Tax=Capnocytophaga catalasegens TaxID=1004260 RepID=A0AAV5APW1_9FLAO|nr:nicotinamide riboside transporter PnuC [Capnocytophaga catalasegens]GIZ14908.1 nicotinamide mononucleotide transporter [Capnocytophaga catalasegens]GJM49287.1 nicotinamide mononucleotide transporter [Capnocytophaga catalasegens]GJM52438.1 nicotinamide mononucleotide transporter [Capnocytophaga catalasegens]
MNHFFDWFFEQYRDVPPLYVSLEIIGIIFGLLSVFFSKKRNILVYPTGIISTMIFVYLLWINQLFGDMLINAYYTIMSVYGWVLWTKSSTDTIHVNISKTTRRDWLISSALAIFSWLFVTGVYWFKPYINNGFVWNDTLQVGFQYFSWLDWADIFTTSIFLVGMWLMAERKIENWICWIIGDIISVPLYYYKGLIFSSFQYFVFTIIAVLAYIEWKKTYHKQQQASVE